MRFLLRLILFLLLDLLVILFHIFTLNLQLLEYTCVLFFDLEFLLRQHHIQLVEGYGDIFVDHGLAFGGFE